MAMKLLTLLLSFFFSLTSFSQTNDQTQRECRISTGFGFASATQNTKSIGSDVWVQLDYRLLKNISIATKWTGKPREEGEWWKLKKKAYSK